MHERRNPRYLWPLLTLVMFGALLYSFVLSKVIAPVGDAIIAAAQQRERVSSGNRRAAHPQGVASIDNARTADPNVHPASN